MSSSLGDVHITVGSRQRSAVFQRCIEKELHQDVSRKVALGTFNFCYQRFENFDASFGMYCLFVLCTSPILFIIRKKSAIASVREREAAIGRISSNLSHDLRSPLGSIERLLYLPDSNLALELQQEIRHALFRINSMIESIRYSERELLVEIKKVEFDLNKVIPEVVFRAQKKGFSCVVNMPNGIFLATLDASKVERAWLNLVSNAIDFAKSEIQLHVQTQDKSLIMRVIDDGPGVPDGFLPRLFQRGATHGKTDGTGLGLAYVRQIMRGHGGDVKYYRGSGMTVFECVLPNAVVEKEDKSEGQAGKYQEIPQDQQRNQPNIKQVSICFRSDLLNQRVHERLLGVTTESHSFITGFHRNSSIVLTDFEEMAEEAMAAEKRIIMFEDTLSDDEIVRRAPIRLGLRG